MRKISWISLVLACFLILPMLFMIVPEIENVQGETAIGTLDANIAGTVENGTSGMAVIIRTLKTPNSTANPNVIYFNGTTDPTGSFNITVDSDLLDVYSLNPYSVMVEPIYYKEMTHSVYNFLSPIQSGETMHVPDRALRCVDPPLGRLEIRIFNKTVTPGNEIEGSVVTIDHVDEYPAIPFSQAQVTDGTGLVVYDNIRAVETSVEATKLNFQDLSSTIQDVTVDILPLPSVTTVDYYLDEDPWPFTTDPSKGDLDGNVTRGITINFGQEMDETSMRSVANYKLVDDQGADVDFEIIVPSQDNDRAVIKPLEQIEYYTNHTLSIFARIRSLGGGIPLWRTMDVDFRTEKAPALVSGRLVETGTTYPAYDVELTLVDQKVISGPDGRFTFPLVIPGMHDLVASDGYLFDGTEVEDIEIIRGDVIELGDIEVSPQSWGSMNVTILSGGILLEGGWVKIISSILEDDEFNITTGEDGIASFSRVRSGNVNIKVGAPHHDMKVEVVIVPESGLGEITIDLNEDSLPVTVQLTDEISPGIAGITSDLLVQMPEPILFQSLNISLWMLDAEGARSEEITLSSPQEGTLPDSYLVRIQGDLPLESSFEFMISEELLALDDGEKILWRELSFEFDTLELPLAYLNGTLVIEGRSLEGVEIEFNGQSGTTDEDGQFNVSIDLDVPLVSGLVTINLTVMGYQLFSQEIQLGGGQVYQLGTIDLVPREDWFSIAPAPGNLNIEPDVVFNITFGSVIQDPESGFSDIFKLVKEGGSAPISGVHTVTNGNFSLVFDPDVDLDDGSGYTIIIEDTLLQDNGLPFFPVGKTLVYRVKPPAIDIEVIQPAAGELNGTELDLVIRISFGYAMNKTKIEGSMTISPIVQGIGVNWLSSSEMTVTALFLATTEYTLSIPPGVYGLADEPLGTQFQLVFTTGTDYGGDHSFTSINMIPAPDTGWETGQTIKVSGTVADSVGYTVVITIGEGDDMKTFTTIVEEDGTWSVDIILPETALEGKMKVSLGTSGTSSAYSKEYDVEIKDPEESNGKEDGDDYTMYYILGAVVILLLIVLIATLYIRSQKKKAEGASDIDYTDVDVDDDWEDHEE